MTKEFKEYYSESTSWKPVHRNGWSIKISILNEKNK